MLCSLEICEYWTLCEDLGRCMKDYGNERDDEPESIYCDCGAVHSGIEDGGRCEACGKVI